MNADNQPVSDMFALFISKVTVLTQLIEDSDEELLHLLLKTHSLILCFSLEIFIAFSYHHAVDVLFVTLLKVNLKIFLSS